MSLLGFALPIPSLALLGQDEQLCGSKLLLGLNHITTINMKYRCSKNTQRDVTRSYLYKQNIKVLISKKLSEEAQSRD